jgi:hypothetical protein
VIPVEDGDQNRIATALMPIKDSVRPTSIETAM